MMSHECNKFIIREGQFVRDFEAMYKALDDPWDQRENDRNDLGMKTAFFLVHSCTSQLGLLVGQILDVGCADGYHDERLSSLFPSARVIGTDISKTVITRARERCSGSVPVQFFADDIRVRNKSFVGEFDIVFSSKTLYYVGPEIDDVLDNIGYYLKPCGLFCFVYNQTDDAFSNQWLTYQGLRTKLLDRGYSELIFVELDRFSEQTTAIGMFLRGGDDK